VQDEQILTDKTKISKVGEASRKEANDKKSYSWLELHPQIEIFNSLRWRNLLVTIGTLTICIRMPQYHVPRYMAIVIRIFITSNVRAYLTTRT
jgi:hypothetical protein